MRAGRQKWLETRVSTRAAQAVQGSASLADRPRDATHEKPVAISPQTDPKHYR